MPAEKNNNLGKHRGKKLRKGRIVLVLGLFVLLAGFVIYRPVARKLDRFINPKAIGTVRVNRYRDFNSEHLVHAKQLGITPFKTEKQFNAEKKGLVSEGKLEKITNGNQYIISKLGHSHPYLVPEAAKLLDDIGNHFAKKLDENDKGRYYFRVSSLLRTAESQKKLSRSNSNAAQQSAHLYGTTFDIAYSAVVKKPLPWIRRNVADASVIKLLSDAIGELKKEGRCLVVTEYKEKCFHITVVK